jgi:hypothetical protein
MGLLLLQNSMLKLKATGRKNFMAQASQLERYVILSTLPLYFPMFFGLNFPEYAISFSLLTVGAMPPIMISSVGHNSTMFAFVSYRIFSRFAHALSNFG